MGVEKVPKYDIPTIKVDYIFIELDKMKPHEQLVQKELEGFVTSVTGSGIFWKPMLLAKVPGEDMYLIVDGHHRWAGLQKLGAKKAPSVILDYFSDDVKVYTWYPAFKGDLNEVIERLKAEGLEVVEDPSAEEKAERGEVAFAIVGEKSFAIPGALEEQKKVSKVLDEMSVEGGIELIYYGLKEDAREDMAKGETSSSGKPRPRRTLWSSSSAVRSSRRRRPGTFFPSTRTRLTSSSRSSSEVF